MNMHNLKTLIMASLVFLMPTFSMSAGMSYSDNQVFSHAYVDFKNAGPLHFVDYPFSRNGKKLVFQTSYRQLYEIRELTDNRAALVLSTGSLNFGAAAAIFGKSDYFHHTGISIFSNYNRPPFTFGLSGGYSNLSFNDRYRDISWSCVNSGISYSRNEWHLFIVGRNLNQPAYYSGGNKFPTQLEIGFSYSSQNGLNNQIKTLFIHYQKPTAELSQSFILTDYASIDWSLVLRPVRFGAGVVLKKSCFEFDYSFSHHPILGGTHTISISVYTPDK